MYSPIISINVSGPAASWSLYPNPASSTLTIQSAAATVHTAPAFLLFDAQGKLLRTLAIGANDISNLVPGMYIIRSQEKTVMWMKL
jgi:hypothetical protein